MVFLDANFYFLFSVCEFFGKLGCGRPRCWWHYFFVFFLNVFRQLIIFVKIIIGLFVTLLIFLISNINNYFKLDIK